MKEVRRSTFDAWADPLYNLSTPPPSLALSPSSSPSPPSQLNATSATSSSLSCSHSQAPHRASSGVNMFFNRPAHPYLVPKPNSDVMASLPTELLQEVGVYLDRPSLKGFSSTSRGLRAVLLPLIVKDVHITSMDKLKELAAGSEKSIGLIRFVFSLTTLEGLPLI